MGTTFASRLQLQVAWRQLAVVMVTGLGVLLAFESLSLRSWRSAPSSLGSINNIKSFEQAAGCLKLDPQWFVDEDRLNVYFMEHPPLFAFTVPARPLLLASNQAAVKVMLQSIKLKFAVFFESSAHWQKSPFSNYLNVYWARISMTGGYHEYRLWVATNIAECINGKLGG